MPFTPCVSCVLEVSSLCFSVASKSTVYHAIRALYRIGILQPGARVIPSKVWRWDMAVRQFFWAMTLLHFWHARLATKCIQLFSHTRLQVHAWEVHFLEMAYKTYQYCSTEDISVYYIIKFMVQLQYIYICMGFYRKSDMLDVEFNFLDGCIFHSDAVKTDRA